jgi:hypothetical protein
VPYDPNLSSIITTIVLKCNRDVSKVKTNQRSQSGWKNEKATHLGGFSMKDTELLTG